MPELDSGSGHSSLRLYRRGKEFSFYPLVLFGIRVSWLKVIFFYILGFLLVSCLYSIFLINQGDPSSAGPTVIPPDSGSGNSGKDLEKQRSVEIKEQLQRLADENANQAIKTELHTPHYLPAQEPAYLDVTLVTQLSPNYLGDLEKLANEWAGPMSAVIYCRERVNSVKNMISKLRACSPMVKNFVHIQIAFAHYYDFQMDDDILNKEDHKYTCDGIYHDDGGKAENFKHIYPQNRLRNMGRKNIKTAFCLVTDADIIPSPGLRSSFIDYAYKSDLLKLRNQKVDVLKTVWIVPVFEMKAESEDEKIPQSKAQLTKMHEEGMVRPFYSAIMKELQATTNYPKFFVSNGTYEVPYTDRYFSYEPFYICWYDAPLFDERFVRWGFDRRALVYELYIRGYRFVVMADEYLVHVGFKNHVKEQSVMENHYFNAPLWVKFKKEKDALFKEKNLPPYTGFSHSIQVTDGRYLSMKNAGSMGNGAALFVNHIADPTSRNDTNWYLSDIGEIRLRANQKCLVIVGEQLEDAAALAMWSCHGGMSQRWWINNTDVAGFSLIVSRMHNKCLTISDEAVGKNNGIYIMPCASGKENKLFDRQLWNVKVGTNDLVYVERNNSGSKNGTSSRRVELRHWAKDELLQWCVSHNLNGEGRKSLVALSVGEWSKEIINNVVKSFGLENFDFILFHYDDSDWSEFQWYSQVKNVVKPGWFKFQFAKDYLGPEVVKGYEFVYLWDDDIAVDTFNVEEFNCIMRRHNIQMAQPALYTGSNWHWKLTLQRTNVIGRWVEGVEVMCMVFSREAWVKVHSLLASTGDGNYILIGWQIDLLPLKCILGFDKIAIIDHTAVIHGRTGMTDVVTKQTKTTDGRKDEIAEAEAAKKAAQKAKEFENIVANDISLTDAIFDRYPNCKGIEGNGGYLPEFYRQCWDPTKNTHGKNLWMKIPDKESRDYWLRHKCNSHPFDMHKDYETNK
eukprot:Nk52_evm81s215 gene=Nk52_evmTU81s215